MEGGCIAHIRPDHLLDTNEYKSWLEQSVDKRTFEESTGYVNTIQSCIEAVDIPLNLFQLVSKKAWLDCLLQLLKVCVINRITPKGFKARPVPYKSDATFPDVKPDPLISNVFKNKIKFFQIIFLTCLNILDLQHWRTHFACLAQLLLCQL